MSPFQIDYLRTFYWMYFVLDLISCESNLAHQGNSELHNSIMNFAQPHKYSCKLRDSTKFIMRLKCTW